MAGYDLIVVGAGPAGSAAAMTALKAGLSVAVIDKAAFPRSKLCGGLITGRCARHLDEVFGRDMNEPLFEERQSFEFFIDGAPLADMHDVPPAHLTMRWDFDHALFKQVISAGADDLSGTRIKALDLEARQVTLADGAALHFKCLIGADGVQSIVAKELFGESFDPKKIGFALEIEDAACQPNAQTPIRVDFAVADWGYGWSFPKQGSTTIGVGGLQTENPDMKERLAAYLDVLGTGEGVKVKGHFLPFGGYRSRPGREHVLLAGARLALSIRSRGRGLATPCSRACWQGRRWPMPSGPGRRIRPLQGICPRRGPSERRCAVPACCAR